jgi:glycerophosphoryl diester phosphodiesterase
VEHSLWLAARGPLVVAHRGACQQAPENTLAAFRRAIELGAQAIELDTKLTADGHAIVLHDPTLDRTTSGSGRVRDKSLLELSGLDAGAHFDPTFSGEPIPRLEDVFTQLGHDILFNVEVGNYATPLDRLPECVAGLIRKHSLETRVLVSSFNPVALRRIRRLVPDVPLGLLRTPLQPSLQLRLFPMLAPHELSHLHDAMVDSETAAKARRAGRRLVAWTVNDAGRMAELVEWGIFGLITDVPDVALAVVESARHGRRS